MTYTTDIIVYYIIYAYTNTTEYIAKEFHSERIISWRWRDVSDE